jgi:hypothetical protein
MAYERDAEKEDTEKQTLRTTSSSTGSETEKERPERSRHDDTNNGYPDSDHDEVEEMDAGHQLDLELQMVGFAL